MIVAKPALALLDFKQGPFHIALLKLFAMLFSHPCNHSILLSASPQWAMLFIDLESLAGELFKGISTLDAISLFASCQIRRIFTMKPAASADGNGTRQMAPCIMLSMDFSTLLFIVVSRRREHSWLDSVQLSVPTRRPLYHLCIEHEESGVWEDQ